MIYSIVNIIVILLNCVVWYHFGKARGILEALDDKIREIEGIEKAMRKEIAPKEAKNK